MLPWPNEAHNNQPRAKRGRLRDIMKTFLDKSREAVDKVDTDVQMTAKSLGSGGLREPTRAKGRCRAYGTTRYNTMTSQIVVTITREESKE